MPETATRHYPTRLVDPALREIRFLHLHPGPPNSPIECHLTTASLSSTPKPFYEALSYVWGDPSNRPSILLHGSPFPVTRNLFTALHYLRSVSEERILWIDAVVINQQDIDERNAQVSMMDAVYTCASNVLIWLGEAEEGSDDVFDVFKEISEGREDGIGLERKMRTFNVCYKLKERPWFQRVWILQELGLATVDPMVGCGTKWISWETFMKGWRVVGSAGYREAAFPERELLNSEGKMVLRASPDILDDLRQAVWRNKGESLMQLILVSRPSLATEPRDKIYGLLGMMKEEDRKSISVDYRKPIPVVYAEAMTHLFTKGRGPFFLSMLFLQGVASPPGWPTWVPDFAAQDGYRRNNDGIPSGFTFYPRSIGVSGSGANADNGRVLDDKKTLHVGGMLVDVVREVLTLEQNLDRCLPQLPRVEDLFQQAQIRVPTNDTLRPYFDRYKRKEALWQTLIMNQDTRPFTNELTPPSSFEDMYEVIRGTRDVPENFSSAEDYVRAYTDNLCKTRTERTFFTTENGLIGLGVPGIQRGDHVTIWFGAPVPFVIRPIEDDSKKDFYNLVGVAYVAGIMDGEMVDEIYCEELADTDTFFIV